MEGLRRISRWSTEGLLPISLFATKETSGTPADLEIRHLSESPTEGQEARQERFARLKTVLDSVDSRLDQAREIDRVRDNERARLRAEMDHDCPIRIPSLFSFPPAPFPRNEKEDDPTSTIGRSPGYSNKLCFLWFSHVTTSVPIRSIRNGSVKHSIREPGLYSSVWYSFSFGSWNHIQQWLEQLAKSNDFTYFIAPNRFSYLY
ncbi:hypothetical protein JHK82_040858 [Glycine max]|nr:hypothetical protein JHK82_040858 [Glycine max]